MLLFDFIIGEYETEREVIEMKIIARVYVEAEITDAEAAFFIDAANTDQTVTEEMKQEADKILKKAFPNVGCDSYISGAWLEELSEKLGHWTSCYDLDIPEREEAK